MGGNCVACPAGRFKVQAGPGKLNSSASSDEDVSQVLDRSCSQCPAGKFSLAGSSRCTDCRDRCEDGSVINGTCAAGAAQDALCAPCKKNTYKDSSSASCLACDPNSETLGLGSPSATSCKCKEGFTMVEHVFCVTGIQDVIRLERIVPWRWIPLAQ